MLELLSYCEVSGLVLVILLFSFTFEYLSFYYICLVLVSTVLFNSVTEETCYIVNIQSASVLLLLSRFQK